MEKDAARYRLCRRHVQKIVFLIPGTVVGKIAVQHKAVGDGTGKVQPVFRHAALRAVYIGAGNGRLVRVCDAARSDQAKGKREGKDQGKSPGKKRFEFHVECSFWQIYL